MIWYVKVFYYHHVCERVWVGEWVSLCLCVVTMFWTNIVTMFWTNIVHTWIFFDRSWCNKYIQKTPIRVKVIRKQFFLRTWTFSNHWPRFYRRFSFSFFSISIRDTVGYWYLTFVSGFHTSKEGVNHISRKEYSCNLLNKCCGSGGYYRSCI